MKQIVDFITRLSLIQKSNNTTNLYFGNNHESEIRRNNLKIYLIKMKKSNPDYLILGEAPGYKGCRLSGVAFTSERILSENVFFKDEPIQFINSKNNLESEISATIVWNEISKFDKQPLLWNIVPFHPHSINNIKTNRTPTKAELEEDKIFLNSILKIFDIKKIIALGKKSESQLTGIGLPYSYVRHPANGGKKDFVNGLHSELNFFGK